MLGGYFKNMIFVTVGTQKFQFDRLIKIIDDFAQNNNMDIFCQIGNSSYIPKYAKFKQFLSKSEFDYYLHNCEVVIAHSGVATIIEALKLNKKIIVVPRLKRYGEHVDDHQVQIAKCFDEKEYVRMFHLSDNIEMVVSEVLLKEQRKYVSNRNNVIAIIETFLEKL